MVERGGDWVALAPVRPVWRWHHVPARGLAIWSHRYCFLGDRLSEQLGSALECYDEPTRADEFIQLEASGWKGRAGTAFGSDPAHAEFFRETRTQMDVPIRAAS